VKLRIFIPQGATAMRTLVGLVMGMLLLAPGFVGAEEKTKGGKKVAPALNFKMKTIAGREVDLSQYQGKVVLLVNVASKCGNTPQYKGLQELYDKYGKEGFVVIGVPANDFGRQEPGTNEEIAKFCSTNYQVTFPMLAKVSVKGVEMCPLYKYLTSKETDPKFGGEIPWNFEKFLIGRNGEVAQRFNHRVKPESEPVVKAIEAELHKK
jgi:glutathione peroxidase